VMRALLAARIERMLSAALATAAVLHLDVVTPKVVQRCHELDAPVLAWTALTAEEVTRLDGLGVDGVVADDPGIFAG